MIFVIQNLIVFLSFSGEVKNLKIERKNSTTYSGPKNLLQKVNKLAHVMQSYWLDWLSFGIFTVG